MNAPTPDGGTALPAFEPHKLTERIVGAVEGYLGRRGGDGTFRRDLQALVNAAIDGGASASAPSQAREVTVLLSDIRGFTSVAETHPLPRVAEALNRHFSTMCDVIYRYGGTVDKFMGDSIMALFGTPVCRKDAAESAIACAIAMQREMEGFNRANERLGLPALHMGIGINTGEVLVGRVGSELHSEDTVIGNEVNLASRIESCCLRGQILIGENTLRRSAPGLLRVRDPIPLSVKGKRDPVRVYEVVSLGPPWNLEAPERDVRRSPRASVHIPFSFQVCEGKLVIDGFEHGTVRNISIGGLQAATEAVVQPHLNVRFRLRLGKLGVETGDIYGKVLTIRDGEPARSVHMEFVNIAPEDREAIDAVVRATLAAPPASSARQREPDRRAPGSARRAGAAAVGLHELARDREAEPGAARLARP